MIDIIEKYFMERISTHLCVLEDYQMNPEKCCPEEGDKISIIGCKDTLNTAKKYMKMLNKYQRMKHITMVVTEAKIYEKI